jgi:hypothetical protein
VAKVGENTVLLLQTARFLIKTVRGIEKKKPLPETTMYLEEIKNLKPFVADYSSPAPLLLPENLRKIFLYNACEYVRMAHQKISK